jgi:hypothetical protein
VEEGEACSEARPVEDDALFAEEEEGGEESVGQSLGGEADGAEQELVEAVVGVEHFLGRVGQDVRRNSESEAHQSIYKLYPTIPTATTIAD